jgi:hypothetical protein
MTFSLYDATVANYLQILGAVSHFLEKSRVHFEKNGIDLADIVGTRLAADMLPLRFQIHSVVQHSRGAIEAAKTGEFFPPGKSDLDYAALQKLVADARTELAGLTREHVNALLGRDVIFKLNADLTLPFTAEGFLMSFSLPNFYFHASTAYGILRHRGAPLGKRDFMGRPILKS